MICSSASAKQTQEIARDMGRALEAGVLCLYGDLGAGKTTFVRGLAQGLGVSSRIQSPTFTYHRIHTGRRKLYHFDCYRLARPDPILIHELQEILERNDGIVVIEWADRIQKYLPSKRIDILFTGNASDSRTLTITSLS